MRAGTLERRSIPLRLFRTFQGVQPRSATEQSAPTMVDQTSAREEARLDRIHGAVSVMPATLWIALFFISAVIFAFMLSSPPRRARVDPGHVDRLGDRGADRVAAAGEQG